MKKADAANVGPNDGTQQRTVAMPTNSVAENPPIDSRISNIPPDPPLRLTLAPESDDEELKFMRAVLRHYVWQFGADRVRQAVEEIVRGDA